MKALIPISIFILCTNLFAGNDSYVISQQGYVKIMPVSQSFTIDDEEISEFSIPLQAYYPINREMSFSLFACQANVYSNTYINLNGFSDPQITFNYYNEKITGLFSLSINLPAGKQELAMNEFETSSFIVQEQLNFNIPGFGQGLNIIPGVTWAYPLNDNFIIGLGASYQYKGPYKPLKEMDGNYDPGDEILFTTGFDILMMRNLTLSADMIYTTYGEDKVADNVVYNSGDKMTAALMLKKTFSYNELTLFARYRSKGKNSMAAGGKLVEEAKKTSPDNILLYTNFHWHNSRLLSTNYFIEMNSFEKTAAYEGITLVGFGAGAQINLTGKFQIPIRIKYISGKYDDGKSLSGLEGMLGLDVTF